MPQKEKLFISYPHQPQHCVSRVILSLKKKLDDAGYDVWLDERIKTGHDWREEITKGLCESQYVLVFLSEHSTRRDSICLDEMAMAVRHCRNQIVSVLLEPEDKVKMPLVLGRIQLLRMEEWEKKYEADSGGAAWTAWLEERAEELVKAFERRSDLSGKNELDVLRDVLEPDQYWDEIANRVIGFVGREWITRKLVDRLKMPDGPRLLWLHGGPGVGKTSIAAKLAHDLNLPAAGVYFCRFDRKRSHSAEKALRTLAYQMACSVPTYRQGLLSELSLSHKTSTKALRAQKKDISKLSTGELFKKLLLNPSYIGGEPHLLVIDGLDEITTPGSENEIATILAGAEFRKLQKWLRVLVTSRADSALMGILAGVESEQIHVQSEDNLDDIRLYLTQQTCLGEGVVREKAIETLVSRSEGTFIYVTTAIDAITRDALSLESPESFPDKLEGLYWMYLDRSYRGASYARKARPLLELLVSTPEPLPEALAMHVLGCDRYRIKEFAAAMGSLLDVDLLATREELALFHRSFAEWLPLAAAPYTVDGGKGRRRLLQAVWKEFLSEKSTWREYVIKTLPALLEGLTDIERREIIGQSSDSVLKLLNDTVHSLKEQARWREAVPFARMHLEETKLLKGVEHLDTIRCLRNLGALHRDLCNYDAAQPLFEQALEISDRLKGLMHLVTIACFNSLARLLYLKGELAEARKLFETAMDLFCAVEPQDDEDDALEDVRYLGISFDELDASSHLGMLYCAQGEYHKGHEFLNGTAEIRTDAANLHSLGWSLLHLGMYDEAVDSFSKALKMAEEEYGEDDLQTAMALNSLSSALWFKGDFAAALPLAERALDIQKVAFPSLEHRNVAVTLHNISSIRHREGNLDLAVTLVGQAIDIMEKTVGKENAQTGKYLSDLGAYILEQGDAKKALPIFKDALSILKNKLPKQHHHTAETMRRLACCYRKVGRMKSAESLYFKALQSLRRSAGPSHLDTINAQLELAFFLLDQEKIDEGVPMLTEGLIAYSKTQGGARGDTAVLLNNRAVEYLEKRKYDVSKALMERALSVGLNTLQNGDPELTKIRRNLARMYQSEGNHDLARTVYCEADHALP